MTDDLGRKVRIVLRPQRIVSLTPSHTEILFAIGAGEQVVGVTTFCNYPPEAESREKVGGFSENSISLEKVVGLQPDLVLASSEAHRSLVEQLEYLSLPVVAFDATSFDDVYRIIRLIGHSTDRTKEADELTANMLERIRAVESRAKRIEHQDRVAVFYQVWDKPLMTASRKSVIGEMIERSGGINVFADMPKPYPIVSEESVLAKNPQVIFSSSHGKDERERVRMRDRPGWSEFDAVKNDRIYFIDADLVSRFGPRIVDGLEKTAQALYPTQFPGEPISAPEPPTKGIAE